MTTAGIGEEDVELAVRRLDGVRHPLHVGLDAGVGLHAVGALAQLGDSRVEDVLAAARDVDDGAMLEQALGRSEAYPGGAASDERDAPLKCLCSHGIHPQRLTVFIIWAL